METTTNRRGNLAAVKAREEQDNVRLERWNKEREKQAALKLTGDEIRAMVVQLLDRMDQVLAECVFQFEMPLDGCSGQWSKGLWLEEFVKKLEPNIAVLDDLLVKVLMEISDDKDRFDLDSKFTDVSLMRQKASYVIGVLFGARLAGMQRERVERFAGFLDGWF